MWTSGVSLYSIRASTPLSRFMSPRSTTPVPVGPPLHSLGGPVTRLRQRNDTSPTLCKAGFMSLVTGRGPLSKDPAGWFSPPVAAGTVYVEPHPRRVQALRAGHPLIDTERALLVHRPDRPLSYAFPIDEIGDLPGEPVAQAPGFV